MKTIIDLNGALAFGLAAILMAGTIACVLWKVFGHIESHTGFGFELAGDTIADAVEADRFDVVIPTKNSASTLATCLTALRESDIPVKAIYVVDKHSRDATRNIAHKFRCRYISSNANYSQALRLGAQLANTQYILILDSDVIVNPEFYSLLKNHLDGKNLVVKGYYRHVTNWPQLAECFWRENRDKPQCLEAAFVHRQRLLSLTESWENGVIDAGGDTWLFRLCQQRNIPIIQRGDVVNLHLTGDYRRLFKQARWYGASDRASGLSTLKHHLLHLCKSPWTGFRLAVRYKSLGIMPFQVYLRLNYLWGFCCG